MRPSSRSTPAKSDAYEFECSRLCGAGHNFMRGAIVVGRRRGVIGVTRPLRARSSWVATALGMAGMLAATAALTAQRPVLPGEPLPGVTPSEFEEFALGLEDFSRSRTRRRDWARPTTTRVAPGATMSRPSGDRPRDHGPGGDTRP